MNTFLEIFVLVDVFFVGVLVAFATRHWFSRKDDNNSRLAANTPIPQEVQDKMMAESQEHFRDALGKSSDRLERGLEETSKHLNELVDHLGTEIVGNELENYRQHLGKLREQAELDINGIQAEIAKHEGEIKAKLAEEMAAEKQRLVAQLDTKLADAVASFLVETLQHNVDLGAQTAYVSAMLEEHKADFVKEVADDAQPAK